VILFVERRQDGDSVYWADQWAIDFEGQFYEVPGSMSGFRRYERDGFDRFVTEITGRWWNEVFSSRGTRWNASFWLWKLRSR
jgi:hypothetical protein